MAAFPQGGAGAGDDDAFFCRDDYSDSDADSPTTAAAAACGKKEGEEREREEEEEEEQEGPPPHFSRVDRARPEAFPLFAGVREVVAEARPIPPSPRIAPRCAPAHSTACHTPLCHATALFRAASSRLRRCKPGRCSSSPRVGSTR